MADWELRPATPADLEPLAELRAVVMRPDLERLGRYDPVYVRRRLRDAYRPEHTWIVEVAGVFAGSIALRPADDADQAGGSRWLEHFYLADEVQGRGIGGAILREVLAECDRDGVVVRLNVLQGSPARRLYERHGFTLDREDDVDVFLVRRPL